MGERRIQRRVILVGSAAAAASRRFAAMVRSMITPQLKQRQA
jgi:hypothetical protein